MNFDEKGFRRVSFMKVRLKRWEEIVVIEIKVRLGKNILFKGLNKRDIRDKSIISNDIEVFR